MIETVSPKLFTRLFNHTNRLASSGEASPAARSSAPRRSRRRRLTGAIVDHLESAKGKPSLTLILSGRKPEVPLQAKRFAERTQWKRGDWRGAREPHNTSFETAFQASSGLWRGF